PDPTQPASFTTLFQSSSAGSVPLTILVKIFRGTQLIASGTTTRTLQDTPIVTVDGEKTQVEVKTTCAANFACDNGNRAPILTAVGNQALAEGETKTIDLNAMDPDGDAVTFSLVDAPRFMTLDSRSNRITLAPGFSDAGIYPNIKIRVTD